jgi:hypothetical protein
MSVRRSDHQFSVIQVELLGDPNAQVHSRANCTVRGSAFPPCGAWAIRNHQTGTAPRRGVPISHQELKGIVRTRRKGKSTDRPLKAAAIGVGRGRIGVGAKFPEIRRSDLLYQIQGRAFVARRPLGVTRSIARKHAGNERTGRRARSAPSAVTLGGMRRHGVRGASTAAMSAR